MKVGAEPKKVATFAGLLAVAGIVYWMNSSSDSPAPSPSRRPAAVDPATSVLPAEPGVYSKTAKRRTASGHAEGIGAFEPKLPDKVDPSKVDPTLRLDLLAKVQSIEMEGGQRKIFQREAAPPPTAIAANRKVPDVKPIDVHDKPPAAAPSAAPAKPAGPPPPPPINLKYYGYSTKRSDGEKKAFFLDGDDIIVAAEGEIIKKQYKVVRIGVNSVQMEDTASKSTQSIPLQQEPAPA